MSTGPTRAFVGGSVIGLTVIAEAVQGWSRFSGGADNADLIAKEHFITKP